MSRHHREQGVHGRRWRRVRWGVLQRAGWRCATCGGYGNEVDHIKPLSQGGEPWARSNLQCLCAPCHALKTERENAPRDPERRAWGERLHQLQRNHRFSN